MLQKKITFDSFIRGILTAVVIIGILYLVNQLSGVLLPFFVAWLIAYLIYPMVIFFQHKLRLKNRVISIFVVLLVLLSIITLAFIGLVPPIIEEFGKLKELLTEYFIEGSKQAAIPGTVANFIKEHIDMLKIHEALNENNFANTMRNVLPQVWTCPMYPRGWRFPQPSSLPGKMSHSHCSLPNFREPCLRSHCRRGIFWTVKSLRE